MGILVIPVRAKEECTYSSRESGRCQRAAISKADSQYEANDLKENRYSHKQVQVGVLRLCPKEEAKLDIAEIAVMLPVSTERRIKRLIARSLLRIA